MHRFFTNMTGKIEAFSSLLRLKNQEEFTWGEPQQLAFDQIRKYLSNTLVLMPSKVGRPLKLCLSAHRRMMKERNMQSTT